MMTLPFWQRLSTRLAVLILVIVLVLAGATAVLLVRGFSLVTTNTAQTSAGVVDVSSGVNIEPVSKSDLPSIVRGTVINLIAIFLLTLVGAALFSRTLLTEPIASLAEAAQEIGAGNLSVSLPVNSRSELGVLASTFNMMARSLEAHTQDLLEANEALRRSEASLEKRVQERTRELTALLELSNTTALTLELTPLLETTFDRLREVVPYRAVGVFERRGPESAPELEKVAERGALSPLTDAKLREVMARREPVTLPGSINLFPLIVRDQAVGVLGLECAPFETLSAERLRVVTAFAAQAGVALENTKLSAQVGERAAYEERQHLARELHDSVSQALYSIVLGAHAAKKLLGSADTPADPQRAAEALSYVQSLGEAGLAEMRALIFELRPDILEREGLAAALRKQAEAVGVRHGLRSELEASEPTLTFSAKQALFRVAQEALHNVVKHAQAQQVTVKLCQKDAQVHLTIQDDGVGFETDGSFPGHLGLKGMRERVAALGGELTITSGPKGTTVAAAVPEGA